MNTPSGLQHSQRDTIRMDSDRVGRSQSHVAVIARISGGPIPWTSWALPVLLVANAAMFLLPWARRHPSVVIAYYRLSAAGGVIMFLAIIWQLWNR
jgi:hypothetical protein